MQRTRRAWESAVSALSSFPVPGPAANASPEAAPARPARFYRPELDLVRFLAFFLVFNHHIFSASMSGRRLQFTDVLAEGASAGVSLFFTLSSFIPSHPASPLCRP